MKPLIVGYDPGTTSAVAAIDIRGELVLQESSKQLSEPRTIDQLVNTGLPVLVASDKEKTPSAVESLSSSLGTELFEPQDDLSRSRKQDLGDGDNSHERDAEAAARHAFRRNRSRFRKLKRKARDSDKQPEDLVAREFLGLETGADTTQHSHGELRFYHREQPEVAHRRTRGRKPGSTGENRRSKAGPSRFRGAPRGDTPHGAQGGAGCRREPETETASRRQAEEIEQLRHALTQSQDSEVVPVFDGGQPTDRCVTESRERAQELRENGINARHIDDVDGERLAGFVVCDEFPELKVEEMLG
nr:MAG: protein of unknown function, DUF460 [Candidatus Nanosalinarum sp. J07AB56]